MDDNCHFELTGGMRLELWDDPVADDGDTVRVRVSDTYGVLSPVGPIDMEVSPSSAKTLSAAESYEPPPVGSAHWLPSDRTEAARIRAILYDFDREPTTTPEIVRRTLLAVLEKARSHGVEVLVLPYDFGLAHGGIHSSTWHTLLVEVLKGVDDASGERVHLTVRLEIPSKVDTEGIADELRPLLRTLH